jgi:hypothetical protein
MSRVLCAAAIAACALLPAGASAAGDFDWVFRTPGEVAYCRMEYRHNVFNAFRCITPTMASGSDLSGGGSDEAAYPLRLQTGAGSASSAGCSG